MNDFEQNNSRWNENSFPGLPGDNFLEVFQYLNTHSKVLEIMCENEFSCHRESFCSKSFILAGLLILLVRFLQSVRLKRFKSQFLKHLKEFK